MQRQSCALFRRRILCKLGMAGVIIRSTVEKQRACGPSRDCHRRKTPTRRIDVRFIVFGSRVLNSSNCPNFLLSQSCSATLRTCPQQVMNTQTRANPLPFVACGDERASLRVCDLRFQHRRADDLADALRICTNSQDAIEKRSQLIRPASTR